jgi:TetR/AcrR family transcriptional repressor of nem operon
LRPDAILEWDGASPVSIGSATYAKGTPRGGRGLNILVQSVQNVAQGLLHMGRPLEFDRTDAVTRAVEAFWRFGYASLPARAIAELTGLAKSSLYNSFGSKRDLFLESVDHYASERRSDLAARIGSEDAEVLLRHMLMDLASDNDGGRGCFLVNAAAEFGARDAEVCRHVKAGFDGMRDALSDLICAGQEAGRFTPGVDPRQHAIVLMAGMSGLRVLAKGGCSADELRPVVDNLVAGLTK